MIVLALVLVACGGDGEDDDVTATVAPTEAVVATEAEPTTPAAAETPEDLPAQASPEAAGTAMASAVEIASPVAAGTPMVAPATPVTSLVDATPVGNADATPAPGSAAVPPVAGAAENGEPGAMQVLRGTVTLPGTPNERFVIGDDGCIGLGSNAGLQAGQQVIVRDQAGTIIGLAQLAATGSNVVCSWSFEVEVPESAFYEVSIPMRAEQIYSQDDVAANNGEIELTLP